MKYQTLAILLIYLPVCISPQSALAQPDKHEWNFDFAFKDKTLKRMTYTHTQGWKTKSGQLTKHFSKDEAYKTLLDIPPVFSFFQGSGQATDIFPERIEKSLVWKIMMCSDDIKVSANQSDISQSQVYATVTREANRSIDYGDSLSCSGRIMVKSAEIYYEIYGKGEPLLLLHGNGQSINVFKDQIAHFSKSYRVIAVDTRGHGKSSDSISGPLSYDLFAEDMKTLLDSLHVKKANIVGWSDGGNTGLIMGSKYPDYVSKLAVTGACTNPYKAVSNKVREEVKRAIENLKTKTDKQSAYQIKLLTMLLTEPHMSAHDLKKIKAPVLVMAGEKDLILKEHTEYIAANINNSSLFFFKNATHYVPTEKVSEFNNKVMEFMKSKP